jgi:SAM-dependent methyltransferase
VPESVCCNLCGSTKTAHICTLRDYRLQIDDVQWNIVRCNSCGLGYLNPRPTRREIKRYYPGCYFSDRAEARQRYERQATLIDAPVGSLLDIGTASGEFLAVMRDRGWDVAGIEPSANAPNPHGLPIARARFPEESPFSDARFQAITAWAVFEHLHDPGRAFLECGRLLTPGGRLYVQVPNLDGFFGRGVYFEDVPRHLYFFTESSLSGYARKAGLHLARVTHTPGYFGGNGRDLIRLALFKAIGRSRDDFFEMRRTSRRDRFRQWPLLATAWTALAPIERLVLSEFVVRKAGISQVILAEFEKSGPEAIARPAIPVEVGAH